MLVLWYSCWRTHPHADPHIEKSIYIIIVTLIVVMIRRINECTISNLRAVPTLMRESCSNTPAWELFQHPCVRAVPTLSRGNNNNEMRQIKWLKVMERIWKEVISSLECLISASPITKYIKHWNNTKCKILFVNLLVLNDNLFLKEWNENLIVLSRS